MRPWFRHVIFLSCAMIALACPAEAASPCAEQAQAQEEACANGNGCEKTCRQAVMIYRTCMAAKAHLKITGSPRGCLK